MKYWFPIILILNFTSLFAHKPAIPEGYFRSPVDIKLYLSGTFGEPRSTHFHTGIDIKTGGVEGKNIYAVADGYVSRIAVSPYGYGNALYITHPNGFVSVYGHLQKFSSKIQKWVQDQQRSQTSFAINMEFLDPSLFPVTKGEVVALSGNSGGSGGPHLHFEIRDSLEHPLNPLNFGFDKWVIDQAKPDIYNVFFYQLNKDKFFTESIKKKVSLESSGNYNLPGVINVNTDELGFGVHTVDLFTGTSNKNGVYQIKMYDNEELCYHYQMDELSFDFTKHVYSHCDYVQKKLNDNTVHKCFVEKGNRLSTYPFLNNYGKVILFDNEVHQIRIEVSDYHGNTSQVSFQVKKNETALFFAAKPYEYQDFFISGQRNMFKNEQVQIDFPANLLFEDLFFQYAERPNNKYGPYVDIHNSITPVSGYFDVALKLHDIDSLISDKYLLAYYDYKGRKRAIGGKIRNGFIHAETRALGTYFIDLDTVPPKITPVNIGENSTMTNQKVIQFKAADNLSGIQEYNAFVNGLWVVLEYDAKRAKFTYVIDENTLKGDNTIEVVMADERGNTSRLSYTFTY